ncbi:paired box protein Pax-7-like [Gambusia affinis]|uniref:paired box protein Pax-7-like n=1 Tax=Gambusia affinis TaxID=33528 RepID=UPI001CDD46A6|nr:paired box protein Pax-7-like [Gambusia affinis]
MKGRKAVFLFNVHQLSSSSQDLFCGPEAGKLKLVWDWNGHDTRHCSLDIQHTLRLSNVLVFKVWFSNRRARWRKQAGASQLAAFNNLLPNGFSSTGVSTFSTYQLSESGYSSLPHENDDTIHRPQPLPPSTVHQIGLSNADSGPAYALSSNCNGFSSYSDSFLSSAAQSNPVNSGLSQQVMSIMSNSCRVSSKPHHDFPLSPRPRSLDSSLSNIMAIGSQQSAEVSVKMAESFHSSESYSPTYGTTSYSMDPVVTAASYQYSQYGQTAVDYLAKNISLFSQHKMKLTNHSAVLGMLHVSTGQAY